jgi:site-specific recombinase XerD
LIWALPVVFVFFQKNTIAIATFVSLNVLLKTIFVYFFIAAMYITVVKFLDEAKKIPLKKNKTKNLVEHMSESALATILAQPDAATSKGLRDRFFMVLMYDTGARMQEMLDLKLCDLRLGKTPTVTLHGKGDKTRSVPLMTRTVEHLRAYLSEFHKESGLSADTHLFYLISHGHKHQLSNDCVAKFIRKYGELARQNCPEVPENVHPHMFRHSRAMHLYQNGMDLTLVSQWLGHANLETTQIYAKADTEHKRKAISQATPASDPMHKLLNPSRFTITDEEQIKRLYGLR